MIGALYLCTPSHHSFLSTIAEHIMGVNLYTFAVALGPRNADFGPSNGALGPRNVFFLDLRTSAMPMSTRR